jgi:hypothetical protein
MYTFDMTDEEVRRTKAAVKLVIKLAKGEQLSDALAVGEALLKGRAHAMKAAGANKPNGRRYAEAFREWKDSFKFPTGKEHEALYDAAITCAANRTLSEEIIASLDVKKRVEMGVFGLAVRVRAKVKELEEGPRPPRAPSSTKARFETVEGRLSDLEERVIASEPKALSEVISVLLTYPTDNVARTLADINPELARKLMRALEDALTVA